MTAGSSRIRRGHHRRPCQQDRYATEAKEQCPVSRALSEVAEMTLESKLA